MADVKTLLVANDFSAHAETALRRALLLARQLDARLEVMHVVERPAEAFPSPLPSLDGLAEELRAEAVERLRRQTEDLLGGDPAEIGVHAEVGKDFVAIIRHARKINADLVVAGAHGRHLLRDLFLGTTAEKIVRKGDLPVLVVKRPPQSPYRRVLVPVDFSDASEQALRKAVQLAPEARLDVLHVYELWGAERLSMAGDRDLMLERYHRQSRSAIEEQLENLLGRVGLGGRQVGRHIVHGHPTTLIPRIAEEQGSDLVATGTRGRSGLPYVLLGSVAEHVLRQVQCDVLMVRPDGLRFELL